MVKKDLKINLISVVLMLGFGTAAFFCDGWTRILLFLLSYLSIGCPVGWKAIRAILEKDYFDETILFLLATIPLLCVGRFVEPILVLFLFYECRLVKNYCIDRMQSAVKTDVKKNIQYVNIVQEDGRAVEATPDQISVGDMICVNPGEYILADGIVQDGATAVNTAAITGETAGRKIEPGDTVLAGYINLESPFTYRVTTLQSSLQNAYELACLSYKSRSRTERFINHLSKMVRFALLGAALVLLLLSCFLKGDWWYSGLVALAAAGFYTLDLSVVQAFFSGIFRAYQRGILFREADSLETLADVETIAFNIRHNMEGFAVSAMHGTQDISEEQLKEIATCLYLSSNHPVARAICAYTGLKPDITERVKDFSGFDGDGCSAMIDGKRAVSGSLRFLKKSKIKLPYTLHVSEGIHFAVDGVYAGYVLLRQTMLSECVDTVRRLTRQNVHKIAFFGNDHEDLSAVLKADYVSGMSDEQKEGQVKGYGKAVAVVNEGLPLLRGRLSILLGTGRLDTSGTVADVVIAGSSPLHVAEAVTVANRTMRIVSSITWLVLLSKLAIVLLAIFRMMPLWLVVSIDILLFLAAVFAMKQYILKKH